MKFKEENFNEYKVFMTRKEAIDLLKVNPKVKEVKENGDTIIITTIPVKLNIGDNPIGTYQITITDTGNKLEYNIVRLEGLCDASGNKYGMHIYSDGHVCWGNISTEIYSMRRRKDWYWFAKRCIDICFDFTEGARYDNFTNDVIKQFAENYKRFHAIKTNNGH